MIGLSLPYGAASPVFGVISDKYPVSQYVNGYQHFYSENSDIFFFEIPNDFWGFIATYLCIYLY